MESPTNGAILPIPHAVLALPDPPTGPRPVGPLDLYGALLADAGKDATRRARASDVRDLTRFLGVASPETTCATFVAGGAPGANAITTAYRRHLLDRAASPATVNRRLSTLRRLAQLGRRFGVIDWSIEADNLPAESYRDTKGPGRSGWLRLHEAAQKEAKKSAQGERDLAIMRLLYFNGMRRGEVAALDLADWHPDTARLSIMGKGRYEREFLDVNGPTAAALESWITVRGQSDGPLFIRLDHAAGPESARISGKAIWDIVRALSRKAGLKKPARPHGIRHQAATRAAELSNGNMVEVQGFLRHKDPNATRRYLDNLHSAGGKVGRLLADDAA